MVAQVEVMPVIVEAEFIKCKGTEQIPFIIEPEKKVSFACHQQQGYKYNMLMMKQPLHPVNEDIYFPTAEQAVHEYISVHGDRLFMMADGHAGHEAPQYFIEIISTGIMQLLNSQRWDFGDADNQNALTSQITDIFHKADAAYVERKKAEYKKWKLSGKSTEKPVDDGCTMVVNILQEGYLLNCNVGDSRTVIARKSDIDDEWVRIFTSSDHNMMHPVKVYDIHQRGGKFIHPTGNCFLSVKTESPSVRGERPYTELTNSRLYRPLCPSVSAVGCSHRRTLNLSGTLGDLLFKISPSVLSSTPDFSFVKLDVQPHLMIMATDGLWDHWHSDTIHYQSDNVVQTITSMLETELLQQDEDQMQDILQKICEQLSDREAEEAAHYQKNLFRYDDCTVMLVHIQ